MGAFHYKLFNFLYTFNSVLVVINGVTEIAPCLTQIISDVGSFPESWQISPV